jgi:hypothetical protein
MKLVCLGAFAALSAIIPPSSQAVAAQRAATSAIRMTIGNPNAEHVDVAIVRAGKVFRAVKIDTRKVGAPGSKFTLSVDGHDVISPVILTEKECHYNETGSICEIVIDRKNSAFGPFLKAFRTGKTARVAIENAGNVAMVTDVSLRSVTRALRSR